MSDLTASRAFCTLVACIGTVDKFQGQEAAIVIYSTMTSHADAPRGVEFLYSTNRLNVATSRAKCLCILVGAPAVFEPSAELARRRQHRGPQRRQLAARCAWSTVAAPPNRRDFLRR